MTTPRNRTVALLTAALVAAPAAAQGPVLPAPGGPLPVGTAVFHLADSSRADLASGRPGRAIIVQAWYPAAAGDDGHEAAYHPDPGAVQAMAERDYNRLEASEIAPLADVRTHARIDAAPRTGERRPVVVLSHGHGMSRSHYTALAEDLASRGYLVAAVDHPYGGFAVHPGERIVTLADDPEDTNDPAVLARRAVEWAGDASFVLDRLADANAPLGLALGAVADVERAAAVGHSFGGAAALEACRLDARFRACVNMDGLPFGPAREQGVGKPVLVLLSAPVYSDAELAARGRTREQWQVMGARRHADFAAVFAHHPDVPAWVAEIHGTGHHSFSDAPFTLPSLLTRWGGRPIEAARGQAIITGCITGFLDRYLRNNTELGCRAAPQVSIRRYGAG